MCSHSEITKEVEESEEETVSKSLFAREEIESHRPDVEQDKSGSLEKLKKEKLEKLKEKP